MNALERYEQVWNEWLALVRQRALLLKAGNRGAVKNERLDSKIARLAKSVDLLGEAAMREVHSR